jgi:hypothetical protein
MIVANYQLFFSYRLPKSSNHLQFCSSWLLSLASILLAVASELLVIASELWFGVLGGKRLIY